ncbi:TLC domain-containing protein 2-like [Lingula anatina]|uniref:TLC domain-containing protein 2-like n=1 Tax=Lingula anatina TaxID=7574 RepID=A0A1S3GZ07_LINAN|nr:TLC domain-containing protein 2-like [Lingula anatina]|eukprot:XP_013378907.1 TLC domain-containing protein 2-like [Lingula anatina]
MGQESYFVYDFFDMFLATENIGSWDMYLHHVVITFFVTYAYFECGCSGYGAWNYLCELSNVALHGRKLITMLGHSKKSSLYKGMNHFYFFTFFVFRFGPQVLGLLKYLSEVIALRVSLLCAFLCIPNQVFLVWIGVDIAYRITLREFFPKEKKEDGGKVARNGGGGGISGAKTLKTG